MKRHEPEKILFVKLCCAGDLVFLTSTVRAVHQRFPNAHLAILVSKWVKEVAERIPWINEVIVYDALLNKKWIGSKIAETIKVLFDLRRKRFDLAVIAHRNPFFARLAAASGIPYRVGFDGSFLTYQVHFNENEHEIRRYLHLVEHLLIDPPDIHTELLCTEKDLLAARAYLTKAKEMKEKFLVGIFPGGGKNPGTTMPIKRWYTERYAELMTKLNKQSGIVFILLGGESDRDLALEIKQKVPSNCRIVDVVGMGGFGELCGILKSLSLFIGGDSGPLHMAAALGTPTVSLFGPSDPRLVAPIGKHHRYIWKQPACSPCYTPVSVMRKESFVGSDFPCRTGTHECIKEISVDEVYTVCKKFLEEISFQQKVRKGRK